MESNDDAIERIMKELDGDMGITEKLAEAWNILLNEQANELAEKMKAPLDELEKL